MMKTSISGAFFDVQFVGRFIGQSDMISRHAQPGATTIAEVRYCERRTQRRAPGFKRQKKESNPIARKSAQTRDGIYQRKDRAGFCISWTDAQGRRRFRKTDATNITQAKQIRSAELLRVEQAKVLGFSPPSEDNFATVARRYLVHQKVRLSKASYVRE